MNVEIDLDDEMFREAAHLTGIGDPERLLRAGLEALIEREEHRRRRLLDAAAGETDRP